MKWKPPNPSSSNWQALANTEHVYQGQTTIKIFPSISPSLEYISRGQELLQYLEKLMANFTKKERKKLLQYPEKLMANFTQKIKKGTSQQSFQCNFIQPK